MSVSYLVGGDDFDPKGWREAVVGELADEGKGWKPLAHTGRHTENEHWLLLVDGSVRGVEVLPEEDGESVRLGAMASGRDFELAHRILTMAMERGATVQDQEGAAVGAAELTKEAAEESWGLGKAILEKLGYGGGLPCGLFSLEVSAEELAEEDDRLKEILAKRVRKYAGAHPATIMVLTSADEEHEISAANYGQVSTLIPKEATHITFGALGGDVVEGVVPVGDFKTVFGELVESAGDVWYVPAVDLEEEKVILNALREKAVLADEALKVAARPVPHPEMKPISDAQWEILESGPALVFLSVAASDGKVGKRETTTFAKVIVGAAHLEAECPSLGRALGASLEKVPEVIARIEATDKFDAEAEMRQIGETVDACLSEDEAMNYKLGLLFIGKEVAEAEGGFFGMGKRINKGEASALKMVADGLGVEVEME